MSKSGIVPGHIYKKAWDLIDEFNQAKTLKELERLFLSGVASIVSADAAVHLPMDNETRAPKFSYDTFNVSIPDEVAQVFISESYYLKDPLAPNFYEFLQSKKRSEATRITDYISTKKLMDSEFFCEILRPLEVKHYIVVSINIAGIVSNTPFVRAPGSRPFSVKDLAIFELLSPQIAKAFFTVSIKERLSSLESSALVGKHCDLVGKPLSPREEEIARLVMLGYTNKQISDQLCISEKTVRGNHLGSIFHKMGVNNRAQLVIKMFSENY